MEKKEKTPKVRTPKEPKAKKSKMPEGYIGRPKPMKTKKFQFHKPTVGNWVELGIFLAAALFVTYIVLRLINVSKTIYPDFEYYSMEESALKQEYVLENDDLRFELDPATTQFSILNKKSGKVWYSNPQNLDEDTLALPKEKSNLQSTFLVKYSTIHGVDETYDTFTKSVQRNFYSVEKKSNEVLVHYTIGEMEREYIMPLAIYEDEYDKFLDGLTKSQKNSVGRAYHKYTIDGFLDEEERDIMLEKYPGLEDQALYVIFEKVQKFTKEQIEKLLAGNGYTMEDYLRHKELYKESTIADVPAFNLTVSYKLDGDKFCVEVPFDDISYKPTYPITQVTILPYFGAGFKTDTGFMFVPEGGGNVINFNNGKTKQNSYYVDLYGWDYAIQRKSVNTETYAAYPVFGISDHKDSFIAVLEEGAPYASISADISGRLNSYNYIRADYKMLHREQFDVSTRTVNAQFAYEKSLPEGEKLKQVYKFCETGDIADMAITYRDYLFKGEKKVTSQNIPLAVGIIGAIDKVQQVAGLPKTLPYELTSYKNATRIIKEIEALGFKDIDYRLVGFINDGINQKYLNKVKFISELGGTSGFNKMLNEVSDISNKLYLDAHVQTAHRSSFLDGFSHYSSPARFVSDEVCEIYQYSPVWYGQLDDRDTYYLLKPSLIENGSKKLLKKAGKLNIGVSYADNGYSLSADYDEEERVSRSKAMQMQVEQFKAAKEQGTGLMIRGGNDYAVKYADFITDVSLTGNNYSILDYTVPFYQIALHGYKNYSAEAINNSSEFEEIILQSAETASGLYFEFMNEKETKIQDTYFTQFYTSNFDSYKDQFVKIYTDYNNKLGKLSDKLITDYEYLSNSVTRTEFENGYEVYVNLGYEDFVTQTGKHVPARDYIVVKKGE